jgi:hypothetical protein
MRRVAKVAILVVALVSLFLAAMTITVSARPIHVGGSSVPIHVGGSSAPIHVGGSSVPIHVGGS